MLAATNKPDNETFVARRSPQSVARVEVKRLNIVASPQVDVKINGKTISTTLDTGSMGSIISQTLCDLTGLEIHQSNHTAVQADGNSALHVAGEVHTTVTLNSGLVLPLNAVVVTKLKAALIVGMDFMAKHKMVIDIPRNRLILHGDHVVPFSNSCITAKGTRTTLHTQLKK